jgi:hypothetical protein
MRRKKEARAEATARAINQINDVQATVSSPKTTAAKAPSARAKLNRHARRRFAAALCSGQHHHGLNRHDRRVAKAAQRGQQRRELDDIAAEGGGVLHMSILTIFEIAIDAQRRRMARSVTGWVKAGCKPCLLCRQPCWTPPCGLPRTWFFLRGFDATRTWVVSAICEDCAAVPALEDRVAATVEELFQGAERIAPPVAAPRRLQ